MRSKLRSIGPGALAAAAFVGPGTVTTATIAGASFGYVLAWALLFATLAAIVLQEMAARIGVVTGKGLGEALMSLLAGRPTLRIGLAVLIVAALFVGNTAYESGNLAGAALGVEAALDVPWPREWIYAALACLAAVLLLSGSYRFIERALVAMVAAMSACFLAAAVIVRPDLRDLLNGLFVPRLPSGAAVLALGLVGTTIVPYNLFLHAAAARTRWRSADALEQARFDTCVSIGTGGAVSLLILVTAAAGLFGSGLVIAGAADMAQQLEPAFGTAATWLLACGLLAAGLTSAVTAPLATAYACAELFGFPSDPRTLRFRGVALTVLAVGAVAAVTGAQPIELILFAQFANGLLLPVIASLVLVAVNREDLLGSHTNGRAWNIIGFGVIALTAALGVRALLSVLSTA